MEFLETVILRNTVREWLFAATVALLIFVVLRVAVIALVRRVAKLAAKTETQWDDLIIGALKETKSLLFLVAAIYVGSVGLELDPRVSSTLETVAIIALLVQAGIWVSAGVSAWIEHEKEVRSEEDAAAAMGLNILKVAARLVVWSAVLLLALENVGVDVTALVAGLGVGGIAVALAAQNILSDLFASLSIIFDKPFVPGDFLNVGDFVGTVEEIGLKTTRVRALSGEQLVFANADLLGSRIRNYGRMYERRSVFEVGVTYQTPREKLERIPSVIREAIEAHGDRVRFDRSHLKAFGDSAIVFETVYFVLAPEYVEYMDIQQAVNLRIHERFEAGGIEFAYPTQTLFLVHEEQEGGSGDAVVGSDGNGERGSGNGDS